MIQKKKFLSMWGIIVFVGFTITQYLVFMQNYLFIPVLWIVLVLLGFGFMTVKSGYGGSSREGIIWLLFVGVGFVLTTSIVTGFLAIDQWYLGSIWLILLGLGALMEAYSVKNKPEMILGIFWVIAGIVLFGLTGIINFEFLYLAVAFGVPLVLIGRHLTEY